MDLSKLLSLQPTPLLLADIDGTCSEFVARSEDATIVPEFLAAAIQYESKNPGHFIFVTGRDKPSADRMIYPNGIENSPVKFNVLSSHGAVHTDKIGNINDIPYTDEEKIFIINLIDKTIKFFNSEFPKTAYDILDGARMGSLREKFMTTTLSHDFSSPIMEIKRDGFLVYLKHMTDDARDSAHKKITDFIMAELSNTQNPSMRPEFSDLQDETISTKSFGLKHETSDQMEVRGPMSKGASLFAHRILSLSEKKPIITFVDTLGPDGTDRTMAKAAKKLDGHIVQVQNQGREQSFPRPGDIVFPDLIFSSPTDLANSFANHLLSGKNLTP